ncbi:MAG: acyl transferase [Chitinophagales bacterium]|nr:acyl transferase [Chitinophagales bacterium]
MSEFEQIKTKILNLNDWNFEEIALEVFHYQSKHNLVYKRFIQLLDKKQTIKSIESIPFLPIEFFKSYQVISDEIKVLNYFESSGTTGQVTSKHYFQDTLLYQSSYLAGFEKFYGSPKDWIILGLLPSYLERQHSSLVNMVQGLIEISAHKANGFYLYNYDKLHEILKENTLSGKNIMLFGVTFALLEFAHLFPDEYKNLTIIETGGMKGRGKELTRDELHKILHENLQSAAIHSEYGMSELFSQAYSLRDGIFECSDTMRVLKRNPYDPLEVSRSVGRGNINVIDLANLHSCSFIATMDIGKFYEDGRFEVLGRADYSDIRGCNLMYQ